MSAKKTKKTKPTKAPVAAAAANPTIPSDILRIAIRAVKRAMYRDDNRPHLACMRLDVTPRSITTSATDGTWLARYTREGEYDFRGAASLVLTRDSALALARWLRPVSREGDGCDMCGHTEPAEVERGFCTIDVATRVASIGADRFAFATYDDKALPPPDLDKVIPPDTDEAFPGFLSGRLLQRISRSFRDALDAHESYDCGLRFRATGPLQPVRITAVARRPFEGSLLVVCMPMKGA